MAQRIFHGSLTANQVEVVESGTAKVTLARVLNVTGTDRIYVRGDGVDPAPPWADCEVIPPAVGWVTVRLAVDPVDGSSDVRLRSPGTPEYSVKFS